MAKPVWIDLGYVRVLRETEKAIHCRFPDGYLDWFAKSRLGPHCQVHRRGDYGILETEDWIVEDKDLWRYEHLREEEPPEPPPMAQGSLPTASRVYRRIAAKWHPDVSENGGEVMKDINELWQAVQADLKRNN